MPKNSIAATLRGLRAAACLAMLTTAAGCESHQIVVSQPLDGQEPTGAERGGVIYSLPMSMITVRGERSQAGVVTYTVTPSIVPDASARFRLRYVSSAWRDDDINLQVDRNGLLTSSRANASDRTAGVLVQLARSAGASAGAFAAPPPSQPAARYPFTQLISVEALQRGVDLDDGSRLILIDELSAPAPAGATPNCDFSVCYRTAIHRRARISSTWAGASEFGLMLVDPHRIEGVDLRGAPLVARTNTLTFDSGMLTGQAMVVPSSAVAAASIPYDVLSGFFSAVGSLLTSRNTVSTQEAALIAAQTQAITNLRLQLIAERDLAQTRAELAARPAVVGLGTPP